MGNRAAALLLVWSLAGCATQSGSYPPPGAPIATHIYVVTQGWHTEIMLRREDLRPAFWPEAADFAAFEYVAVGWGERDYFPAPRFNPWYGIKALFWPTASVLHVVGFDRPPVQQFPGTEVVRLALTAEGLEELNRYIGASHEREDHRAQPLLPSPYGAGWFYAARRSFHLFRTCNVWVVHALQAAGLPVSAAFVLLPESVMVQLRPIGEVLQRRTQARNTATAKTSQERISAMPPNGATKPSPRYPVSACT